MDVDPPTTSILYNALKYWDFENGVIGSEWRLGAAGHYPVINSTCAHTGTYSVQMIDTNPTFMWIEHFSGRVHNVSVWLYPTDYTNAFVETIYTGSNPPSSETYNGLMHFGSIMGQNGTIDAMNMISTIGTYVPHQWVEFGIVNWDNNNTVSYYFNGKFSQNVANGGTNNPDSICIECPTGNSFESVNVDDVRVFVTQTVSCNSFVHPSTSFTLSTNDNDSDATTSYKIYDNTTSTEITGWTTYSSPFTLGTASNGSYTIQYCSWDDLGNESLKSCDVRIDAIAPTTVPSITHVTFYSGTIYVQNQSVITLTTTDNSGGSGTTETWYWYTGIYTGYWRLYLGSFSIQENDGTTIMFSWCSTDNMGNNESISSYPLTFDSSPPVTTIFYIPTAPPDYVLPTVSFTISSSDPGSGVASTWYKYPGISWTQYTGAFTLMGANHAGIIQIQYYSVDNVGNNETVHSVSVYLYIVYGTHVYATYYGLDGGSDLFSQMKTYVNGIRTINPDFTFISSCVFNLTIEDPFNAVIYSQNFNTNSTGGYLDIILPMKWTWFINSHNFTIVINITRGNITVSYTLDAVSLNPANTMELYLALGTYTVNEYYTNGTMITGINESRVATTRLSDPSSFTINFGWVKINGNGGNAGNENAVLTADYLVLIIVCVAIGAVIVDITIRRKSPEHSRRSKSDEPSSIGQIAGHHTRG